MSNSGAVVHLHITARDADGKVIADFDKLGDPLTDQWQAITAAMFKNMCGLSGTSSSTQTFSCKDTTGTARTLGGAASNGSPFFSSALAGVSGSIQVGIGTSTTTATHADYGLNTAISGATGYPAISTFATANPSGNIDTVQFSVTITLSSQATVAETAVFMVVLDSSGTQRTLCINHDNWPGTLIPANGSISMNYAYQWNNS